MKTTEEVLTERKIGLYAVIGVGEFVGKFGDLYRVSESLWKERLPNTYSKKSTRKNHPGCSIQTPGGTLNAGVLMLHGTSSESRRKETVVVSDIFGEPHTTYFGGLDPVRIPLLSKRQVSIAEKSHVTQKEECELRELCKRKGWI